MATRGVQSDRVAKRYPIVTTDGLADRLRCVLEETGFEIRNDSLADSEGKIRAIRESRLPGFLDALFGLVPFLGLGADIRIVIEIVDSLNEGDSTKYVNLEVWPQRTDLSDDVGMSMEGGGLAYDFSPADRAMAEQQLKRVIKKLIDNGTIATKR